ncbi:hypothetical protein R3P38DRAFT_3171205 [Favolaschia claudopus]|uniref:Uncharacterized protein n=1 Tax=Favolaschia claudopus TaxID=2862362 RepID=A0AAW0DSB3_9AGAR
MGKSGGGSGLRSTRAHFHAYWFEDPKCRLALTICRIGISEAEGSLAWVVAKPSRYELGCLGPANRYKTPAKFEEMQVTRLCRLSFFALYSLLLSVPFYVHSLSFAANTIMNSAIDTPASAVSATVNNGPPSTPASAATNPRPKPGCRHRHGRRRALSYQVDVTSVLSLLPPVQKDRLVRGWRRRHLEQEHPERANAEDDEEVHARSGASTLKNAHAVALYRAEQQEKEWDYHTDSDDDWTPGDEGLKLQDIIIWDGTRPEQTAHTSTDAGVVADKAIAKDLAEDAAEEIKTGKAFAMSAVRGNIDNSFFQFVPASLLAAVEDEDEDDDSLFSPDRSPIPSLQSVPPSPVADLDLGERMVDVEYPSQKVGCAAAGEEKAAAGKGKAAAAPATHRVQLVNIGGASYVECGCVDGKHLCLCTRKTFAFEALDGTVVVKKFRTMVVALN